MKILIYLLLFICGCSEKKPAIETRIEVKIKEKTAVVLSSKAIEVYNPLLPLLEKELWEKLMVVESKMNDGDENSRRSFIKLADEMSRRHPLIKKKNSLSLGGISLDRQTGVISLNARLNYPREKIIEVILCTQAGRHHESLLISKVRPLHLEVLLHFAGYSKGEQATHFSLFIALPDGSEIPVENLLVMEEGGKLEELTWLFSGSPFDVGSYAPDRSGDHIMTWEAHDAVLLSSDEKIRSNATKLVILPNEDLPNGTQVKLFIKAQKSKSEK